MPLYVALRTTDLSPGTSMALFDGTETAAQGLASAAFARGTAAAQPPYGTTFSATGMPSTSIIQIQGSNTDADGDYTFLAELGPDTNGNATYTDIGYSTFYRAVLSTYVSGSMPTLRAQR